MNALTKARDSIAEIVDALRQTSQARMAASARQRQPVPAPRATHLVCSGNAMIRVVDVDTGRVLGFRRTVREARWLASALERGLHLHH